MKFRLYIVAVLPLCVIGCSNQRYHDWHSGEANTGSLIKSSETIEIHSINGKETDFSLLGQIQTYELAPGKQELIATYADILHNSPDDFEKIRSIPVKLSFSTEKGKTYQLTHTVIDEIPAAKEFSKEPELQIIDESSGKYLQASMVYGTGRNLVKQMVSNLNPRLEVSGPPDNIQSNFSEQPSQSNHQRAEINPSENIKPTEPEDHKEEDSSALKILKYSWQQSSEKDRELFLKWIKN